MAVLNRKEEKIQAVLGRLPVKYTHEQFVEMFIRLFSKDWGKIKSAYIKQSQDKEPGTIINMPKPDAYLKQLLQLYLQNKVNVPAANETPVEEAVVAVEKPAKKKAAVKVKPAVEETVVTEEKPAKKKASVKAKPAAEELVVTKEKPVAKKKASVKVKPVAEALVVTEEKPVAKKKAIAKKEAAAPVVVAEIPTKKKAVAKKVTAAPIAEEMPKKAKASTSKAKKEAK